MHAQYEHSPPTSWSSTSTEESPENWLAYCAAFSPAAAAPRTITSQVERSGSTAAVMSISGWSWCRGRGRGAVLRCRRWIFGRQATGDRRQATGEGREARKGEGRRAQVGCATRLPARTRRAGFRATPGGGSPVRRCPEARQSHGSSARLVLESFLAFELRLRPLGVQLVLGAPVDVADHLSGGLAVRGSGEALNAIGPLVHPMRCLRVFLHLSFVLLHAADCLSYRLRGGPASTAARWVGGQPPTAGCVRPSAETHARCSLSDPVPPRLPPG